MLTRRSTERIFAGVKVNGGLFTLCYMLVRVTSANMKFCCHYTLQIAYTQQKMNNLFRVDEIRIEQCFAAHIVHSCQQYSSALLHMIQAQELFAIKF